MDIVFLPYNDEMMATRESRQTNAVPPRAAHDLLEYDEAPRGC